MVLPSCLSWVTHLEDFHEFVRKYFIHCFISKGIGRSLIFPEEQIPVLCDLDADYDINPINSPVRLDRKDVQMNESCNKEENVNIQTPDDDLVSVVTQSISEIDSDGSKVEERKEDGAIFEVGKIFDSYLHLKETIRTYETKNYVQIGIKDSSLWKQRERRLLNGLQKPTQYYITTPLFLRANLVGILLKKNRIRNIKSFC